MAVQYINALHTCFVCVCVHACVHACSIPDDFKVSPGAVEAIAVRPTYPEQVPFLPLLISA